MLLPSTNLCSKRFRLLDLSAENSTYWSDCW